MMLDANEFFDLTGFEHGELFPQQDPVWKALDRLPEYLNAFFGDGKTPLQGFTGLVREPLAIHRGEVLSGVEVLPRGPKGSLRAFGNGEQLEDAAIVLPGAYLSNERILLGPGSVVEPGAMIRGPVVIGKYCEIRQGAYLRGNCLVADRCVVGHTTEMKSSIFLQGAKAGHFAYVGDSILGRDVNLGAGTKLANLRMIAGNIVLRVERRRLDTGRRKLGAILGDGTETGCNSVLSPGTLMGRRSIVYPGISVPGGAYGPGTHIAPAAGSLRIHSRRLEKT